MADTTRVEVSRIYDVLPDECWVTRSADQFCTDFVGGKFPNGTVWTQELCCLPCLVRWQCRVYGDGPRS